MAHRTHLSVRSYELDSLGHVNQAVYHQYAEHARMCMFTEAGFDGRALAGKRIGPVLLDSRLKYLRELRLDDEFDAVTTVVFGTRKVFHMNTELIVDTDVVAASFEGVFGFMDLDARKLLPNAVQAVTDLCAHPHVLRD